MSTISAPARVSGLAIEAGPRGAVPQSTVRVITPVRLAVYAFVCITPLDMIALRGDTFSLTRFVGILLAFVALLQPRMTLKRPPAAFWLFAAYGLLTLFLAVPALGLYQDAIVRRLSSYVQLLVLFWILTNALRDPQVSRNALLAFALSTAIIASLMNLGVLVTPVRSLEGVRVSFAGANANQIGGTLALGLLTLLGMAYTARLTHPVWKWLTPLVTIPTLFAIMDTGSRGAIVALAGGLLALIVTGEQYGRRLRNLLVFAATAILLYFAVYTTFISRTRLEQAVLQKRGAGREVIYPAALRMFAERPILGWGPEVNRQQLGFRVPMMQVRSLDAHSLYLHIVTESGIVGALVFLAGLLLVLRSAYRARRTAHGLLPVVLLAAVLTMNITSNWFLRKPFWLVMAYAVASGASVAMYGRGGTRKRRVPHYNGVPISLTSQTNAAKELLSNPSSR